MENNDISEQEESLESVGDETGKERPPQVRELDEFRDKYLRLYAEFENYRRRVQKDKDELIRYGNESLLYELLPIIDNLEMALKHGEDSPDSITRGVEITLKELLRVADKFGLVPISAAGHPFDPAVHHAMTQIERNDVEDNIVLEEFRKGYLYRDKVLRPAYVAVSKRASSDIKMQPTSEDDKELKEE